MTVGSANSTASPNIVKLTRALVSVSDKTNLKELSAFLISIGCELYATSSTCKSILEYGYPCSPAEALTNFPEMLGGRVKTLHPNIFGGILARPNDENDAQDLKTFAIKPFELVVCNLYPFDKAQQEGLAIDKLIEYIDIGGVSLLRAAAKNHATVSILSSPSDYSHFCETAQAGTTSLAFRRVLAQKAFQHTAHYDLMIAGTMQSEVEANSAALPANSGPTDKPVFPQYLNLNLTKIQSLRYGENPHQAAAFYKISTQPLSCSLAQMTCFHGKELSYNNMLDIEHALRLTKEFKELAVVIVKHNTPCGVGISSTSLHQAYQLAFAGDTVSPFGGIVCVNSAVTLELAHTMSETFLEAIVAPTFTQEALDVLQKKKNVRLVTYPAHLPLANTVAFTHVQGGFLAQTADDKIFDLAKVTCPTLLKPTPQIMKAFEFAMTVVKHVRSNGIVVANASQTISVAGGFTNRVDAVQHALSKISLSLEDAVLASDAFFPFPDSIELVKQSKIKYIVQPGGSVKDEEVVKACDKYGIGMIFTGLRHFKH